MSKSLVFLHTVPMVDLFNRLTATIFPPDFAVYHIADEILLHVVLQQGGQSPYVIHRLAQHAIAAEQAGSDALQVTCSSVSPCADAVRPMVNIPILKIDEAMIDHAIETGSRIGVAATAVTTIEPTTALLTQRAQQLGKTIQIDALLCEEAYHARFTEGNMERHDRIVLETVSRLMQRNDVVLMAQGSMAHVAEAMHPEEQLVPVLTSPRLAVERAKELLLGQVYTD